MARETARADRAGCGHHYRDVLPGVDLRVTAADDGFGEQLIVKSAKGGMEPRIARTIAFTLRGTGVGQDRGCSAGL
jgi:hypothetical protein